MKKLALAMCLIASPALSQNVNVYGVGNHSCSTLYELNEVQLVGWLGGFITGVNATLARITKRNADITGDTELEIVIGVIKAYCRKNPSIELHIAAEAMITTESNIKAAVAGK